MREGQPAWLALLLGGVIAGTIAIGAASLISAHDPVFILHVIAGGLIGKAAAFSDGAGTAALGLMLQWAMSILIAALFIFGGRFVPMLYRNWIVSGLGYGIIVFFVMNYAVVPLSAYHRLPHFTSLSFGETWRPCCCSA
ncbi:MAG: hypothetical protein ACJ8IR_03595 [Alphaproteobacteria bacterium]